jgi:hypothetical protein
MASLIEEVRALRADAREQTELVVDFALGRGWQPSDERIAQAVDRLVADALEDSPQ